VRSLRIGTSLKATQGVLAAPFQLQLLVAPHASSRRRVRQQCKLGRQQRTPTSPTRTTVRPPAGCRGRSPFRKVGSPLPVYDSRGCFRNSSGRRRRRHYRSHRFQLRSFSTNGKKAHMRVTPAETCATQAGWPPLPIKTKRTIAAKTLTAWSRRFNSISKVVTVCGKGQRGLLQ
jgi:hypothetical protein